jgi:uncharacterized coiled-coil protein SlyX
MPLSCLANSFISLYYSPMQIANPIYDVVFKYLMEDNRVARLIISTIIEEEIDALEFLPQTNTARLEQRSLTVYRLDFSARIKTSGGMYKQVLIEIQKAKFASDIMRFRRYLGEQYSRDNTNRGDTGSESTLPGPIPIVTIYLLGHSLDNLDSPVISVRRSYQDRTNNTIITCKNEFIESLTHDSHIIQIPKLKKKYKTEVEKLLSVFDQANRTADIHILNINEDDFPEKYRPLIRRLQRAIAEPEIINTMNVEDEILTDLENLERKIADQEMALEEKEKALEEKDRVLEEQKKIIEALKRKLDGND